ncbi:VOC family protein [Streptomyces sp. SAJ15]|uniref:VOC family protein n=1 Tax=Streptomyces sp. SAJ15 TaxID=2011095 RepID=UPI00118516B3|nr:VOC family protein [Streptomyces sp. SAJ15]TVL91613.1 glyoxalase [Streptomyces sp. SAJ15]
MAEITDPYPPGTPCWVDLAAPDQQAALDFYAAVFGWTAEIGPEEFGGYSVCAYRGKPVAGIMAAVAMGDQPPPPTVWTTYLASVDAVATQQAIEAAGGSVLMPVMDVQTLGRMLIAADPTQAVFGVWQANEFGGAGIVNEPGAVVWNELNTTDREAASSFYGSVFGIEAAAMEGAEGYFSLNVGGRAVGGMQGLDPGLPAGTPAHWLTYFATDDADATAAKVTEQGGEVLRAPFDMIAGRMAVVKDSQGAPFAVIAPAPLGAG